MPSDQKLMQNLIDGAYLALTEWMIAFQANLLFPGKFNTVPFPDTICNDLVEQKLIDRKVLDRLIELANQNLAADYNNFKTFYDHFNLIINSLNLSINNKSEKNSRDPITKFRLLSGLKEDFDREMERLSRQGHEFSMVMLRADTNQNNRDMILSHIAEALNGNMRSFDEGFHIDEDFLVLSLKQTDRNGAIRFIKRTQKQLQNNCPNARFNAVITQPITGERLEAILQDMQKDLETILQKDDNEIIFRREESPLQKFIED